MTTTCIHLIPNAHLDPVWLWPWRDGYSEVHNTIQSVVDLMRENPDLTFVRSSSYVYQWLEESNPRLFQEVACLIEAGRWEIVGGWVVQSDTIIASGESLIRQAEYAKPYFMKKFKRDINIAYSVDSFGQNVGLPSILAETGFKYYVFQRPGRNEAKQDIPDLFWWQAQNGDRILAMRTLPNGYHTEIRLSREKFRQIIINAVNNDKKHQAVFFGVGDHGGGPTRRQIEWIRELQAEYNIKFSTLKQYFQAVENEDIPVYQGEITHHAPGCYSTHQRVKKWVRACERELIKTESILTFEKTLFPSRMDEAWREYLFNNFHDILPGTSTGSVYREVRDSIGMSSLIAQKLKIMSLHKIANRVDTSRMSQGGVMIFNPLPWKHAAPVQFDMLCDPNATGKNFASLRDDANQTVPIQWSNAETNYGPCLAKWKRLNTVVELPASGYKVFSFEQCAAVSSENDSDILKKLETSLSRISFEILEDKFDTWAHGADRLGEVIGQAALIRSEVIDRGAVFCRLRAHYKYNGSMIRIDLTKYSKLDPVAVDLQIDWREKQKTLKFAFETGIKNGTIVSGQAGDTLKRLPDDCEQPFQDFVATVGEKYVCGIISASISAYDSIGSAKLRLTLCRGVYYADHAQPLHGDEQLVEAGTQNFKLWIIADETPEFIEYLPAAAQTLNTQVEYVQTSNHPGSEPWSREGLLIEPCCVTIGKIEYKDGGRLNVRCYNTSSEAVEMSFSWMGEIISASCEINAHSFKNFTFNIEKNEYE
jgi:alpha-mannosidase